MILYSGHPCGGCPQPVDTPTPFDRGRFPLVAIADDVIAQHRLVTEHFGITTLRAVLGWSMGGPTPVATSACSDRARRTRPSSTPSSRRC